VDLRAGLIPEFTVFLGYQQGFWDDVDPVLGGNLGTQEDEADRNDQKFHALS
jgi:hypothetical protein